MARRASSRGGFERGLLRGDGGGDGLAQAVEARAFAEALLGTHTAQRLHERGNAPRLAERTDAHRLQRLGGGGGGDGGEEVGSERVDHGGVVVGGGGKRKRGGDLPFTGDVPSPLSGFATRLQMRIPAVRRPSVLEQFCFRSVTHSNPPKSHVEPGHPDVLPLGNCMFPIMLQFSFIMRRVPCFNGKVIFWVRSDLRRKTKSRLAPKFADAIIGLEPSSFSSSACQFRWSSPSRYQFSNTLLNADSAHISI